MLLLSKAAANERNHDVTFELASSVFYDPCLLTVSDLEHSEDEARWFSVGASAPPAMARSCRWYIFGRRRIRGYQDPPDLGPQSSASRAPSIRGRIMNNVEGNDMPAEIDFSKGARGLHHIPPGARVLMPVSIERDVWE